MTKQDLLAELQETRTAMTKQDLLAELVDSANGGRPGPLVDAHECPTCGMVTLPDHPMQHFAACLDHDPTTCDACRPASPPTPLRR